MRIFERKYRKFFDSSEEAVSMFLGLVIVVVMIGLIFNFVQKRKGMINLPGVSTSQTDKVGEKNQTGITDNNDQRAMYTVAKGDSLWKIAQTKYGDGNKWVLIAKENSMLKPGVIHSGQQLMMPESEQKVASDNTINKTTISPDSSYIVARGDSLWKISVMAYGDGYQWTKIWRANKSVVHNPGIIRPGVQLSIPKI